MERKISSPLYILALILTLIIFGLGIYLGSLLDKGNEDSISRDVQRLYQGLSSTQLFFLLDDSADFCPVYVSQLNELDNEVERIGYKLAFMENKGTVDAELKKEYFMLESASYLISKKINDKCGRKFNLLLYFYSNKKCSTCARQGAELLASKDNNMNMKIYSFDGDMNSPAVDALRRKFNISNYSYPSIVINEKIYSNLITSDEVKKILKTPE